MWPRETRSKLEGALKRKVNHSKRLEVTRKGDEMRLVSDLDVSILSLGYVRILFTFRLIID